MQTCGFAMVKFPQPNQVKGRLAKTITSSVATELYRHFLLDTVNTFKQIPWPIFLACHPPETIPKFKTWLGDGLEYIPQKGKDLGERLKNGFTHFFQQDYEKVISIASDCPDLPVEFILEAEKRLERNDVVIGPSLDGGYYLIGFQVEKYLPDFFEGISWSTDTVFYETVSKIQKKDYKVFSLPFWLDIDTFDDLEKFYLKNLGENKRALNTMSYLQGHPEILSKKEQ